jgi:hypothetical protein
VGERGIQPDNRYYVGEHLAKTTQPERNAVSKQATTSKGGRAKSMIHEPQRNTGHLRGSVSSGRRVEERQIRRERH